MVSNNQPTMQWNDRKILMNIEVQHKDTISLVQVHDTHTQSVTATLTIVLLTTMASHTTRSSPSPMALMAHVLLLVLGFAATNVSAFVPLTLGRLDHAVAFQRHVGISLAADVTQTEDIDSTEIPTSTFSAADVGPSPLSLPRPAEVAVASSPKTTATVTSVPAANAKTDNKGSGSVPVCGGSNMSSLGAFREQHIPLAKDMIDPKNTPDAARYRKNTNFFQLYHQGRASTSSQ
jgi:hypothetical protein